MTDFVWWFAALSVLAVLIVLWPVLGKRREFIDDSTEEGIAERIAFNEGLHAERLKEYEAQRKTGELSETQYEKLVKDAGKQLTQDNDVAALKRSFAKSRSPWVVLGSAVVLPLIGFVWYFLWGAAPDWDIHQLLQKKSQMETRKAPEEQVRQLSQELHEKLLQRVEQRPDNLNSWIVLARNAFELQHYSKAIEAYQHILTERPDSPQVLTELAQVVYVGSGSKFLPEVKTLFDRALSFDPENTQILGLAGFDAFQAGEHQVAINYWERVLKNIPETDSRHRMWVQSIERAKAALVASGGEVDDAAPEETDPNAPFILVQVDLAEAVKAKVGPDAPVFVYARAWQGAKMPLAMARLTVRDLPKLIRLDESTAMAPGMTIRQFPTLEVVARVALKGTAQPQAGDWMTSQGPVDSAPDQQVALTIDSEIP